MTDPFALSLRLLVELTAARRAATGPLGAGDDPGADLLRALLTEAEPCLTGREQAALMELQREMERLWPTKGGAE